MMAIFGLPTEPGAIQRIVIRASDSDVPACREQGAEWLKLKPTNLCAFSCLDRDGLKLSLLDVSVSM